MQGLETGKYKHYKGKMYEVLGTVMHSETEEEMVLYKPLYKSLDYPEGTLWVRPLKMFIENVDVDDEQVPRFQKDS